ncbi:hypothetical protein [Flavobacterium sp. 3HN19-14]|uniref:hypothetical protein n=1 Tax=Flavobacterium sp. 3HN19-14 TaxID=3448133 RepID=UPI003EDF26A6
MDSFTFQHDIETFCVTATSFPDGIEAAFSELRAILPPHENRHFYGISWRGEDGNIIYKAAAEVLDSDENFMHHDLQRFTIKTGPYNTFYIPDFRNHMAEIPKAFELLLKQHEVDPNGYCLEWYFDDKDVKCMVPLGKEYQSFTGLNKEYN